jgi:hypothetical protein
MVRRTSAANTALKAEHVYICGNTGTGKSSHIKELIKKTKRVIIFDPDDEYCEMGGFVRVTKAANLLAMLRSKPTQPLKIAFVAEGTKAFEFWCSLVFVWRNCLAVAEEIADVTTPSKAPPQWGRLIRRGRKYGVKICAVTQRPAEADKTILCNAAVIRVCALGRNADRDAIAKEINGKVSMLAAMVPLEWVEFRRADLSLISGKLGVKGSKRIN